jgi:hypothetical protein
MARDQLRADAERLHDGGRMIISQCAGTMVEILKHIERQEIAINNLTTQVAWFWEKLEPILYKENK